VKNLAIETSSSACSAALYCENPEGIGHTISIHEIAPMQHTSIILPSIQSLLEQAGLSISDINAIAFGCGPGSFTGIRIAASLAQGLAYADDMPVIPVSSLAAIAQAAYIENGWERLLTAVDARMGQIYWCAFEVEKGLVKPLINEELTAPEAVESINAGSWYGIGDAWDIYRPNLVSAIGFEPAQIDAGRLPSAEAVLSIARDRYRKGEWVSADKALPIYLR